MFAKVCQDTRSPTADASAIMRPVGNLLRTGEEGICASSLELADILGGCASPPSSQRPSVGSPLSQPLDTHTASSTRTGTAPTTAPQTSL